MMRLNQTMWYLNTAEEDIFQVKKQTEIYVQIKL